MNWFPVITEENFLSLKTPDESEDEPLEKFQLEEIVDHWLYEIKKKAKKTIKAAENTDVAPLDENDIKAIILSHATRMLGMTVNAQRSNDLDDLILVNLIC